MRQHIKRLLEHSSLFISISLSFLILGLSLTNTEDFPDFKISYLDKIEHVIAYAILSFFWMTSRETGQVNLKFHKLLLLLIAFGVVIEGLQMTITTSRTGDLLDVFANTIGVFLGVLILKILRPIYLHV